MTLEEARHEANASHKATCLFARGYRANQVSPEEVEIIAPGGAQFLVNTQAQRCTCQGFRENGFCSHVMGYAKLIWEQAATSRKGGGHA